MTPSRSYAASGSGDCGSDATGSSARPELSSRFRRRSLLIAGLFALVFLSQGITAPFSKDQEPQSAQWIADTANGQWLVCRDYYGYLCRKPPLYYWLSAAVVDTTGGRVDEARSRVVSLIAGAAVALEVLAWTAANLGEAAGWLSFLFVLASYGFASRATVDLTDMLLTALIFGAHLLIYPLVNGCSSARRAILAGLLMGLAILTKGPVALVLSALAAFVYLLMEERNPLRVLGRAWPWTILVVSLAIAACWYVPAYLAGGNRFLKVILEEHFGHFLPAAMGGTGEAARPFYYIAARLLSGTLPHSFLLAALVAAAAGGWFVPESRRPLRFQLAMVIAVIVLFSVASAKRDDYILPAIPGLAILYAALFVSVGKPAPGSLNLTIVIRNVTVAIIALVMVGGLIGAAVFARLGATPATLHFALHSSDAAMLGLFTRGLVRMRPAGVAVVVVMVAGAVTIFAALRRRVDFLLGLGVALLSLAGVSLVTGTLRPELSRRRSPFEFAPRVERAIGSVPLFVIGAPNYDFSFYFGKAVPVFDSRHPPAGQGLVFLVARPGELMTLPRRFRNEVRLVMPSEVGGGGGPLGLYQLFLSEMERLKSPGKEPEPGGNR